MQYWPASQDTGLFYISNMATEKLFGLVGRNIAYSFSRKYFTDKFSIDAYNGYRYENFDIEDIASLPLIVEGQPQLRGFNVTIPYKEAVIAYLDELSPTAAAIGAVNTVAISKAGKLTGYNTDYAGFIRSVTPLLRPHHKKALILGTGGASKAIAFALSELRIESVIVSRTAGDNVIAYDDINGELRETYLMINCTPVGTYPKVNQMPPIPLDDICEKHLVYDLIYNPEETLLLKTAREKGAVTKNGYEMLVQQAELAWEIWQRVD